MEPFAELGDHLFRREAGRMVAALTRLFGVHNLALAEDVVQDAFCRALDVWKFRGVPENPGAWLMATAKRRAIDVLRHERTTRTRTPEFEEVLTSEWTLVSTVEAEFTEHAIRDDQLRLMFSCCHPRIPESAQVALMLQTLCGFSIGEIAHAFLNSAAAVEKRIGRAKKVLVSSRRLFDLGADDLSERLPAVHRALYLLFNEGYHGAHPELAVRDELCRDAIRLVLLLRDYPPTCTPATDALAALMYLHAARLPAKVGADGRLNSLLEQDRSQWDTALATEGQQLLEFAARGDAVTVYHVEAAIAAVHAAAPRMEDTDWPMIVALYDTLLALQPSPVIALSRAIAVAQVEGPARGLTEIEAIPNRDRLDKYPFYAAALGELTFRLGDMTLSKQHFATALQQSRNPAERQFFERRIAECAVGD